MDEETNVNMEVVDEVADSETGGIIKVKYADHPEKIFTHRWHAFYKNGLMNNPTVVYGDTEMDAMKAAFAEYRRNVSGMSLATMDKVVSSVKPIA